MLFENLNTISPIVRYYFLRYQQTAIRETGRRPMILRSKAINESLMLPGCPLKDYTFWQPIPWAEGNVPLGDNAGAFHSSIIDYVSLCQFFEMQFHLPIPAFNNTASFARERVFECIRNTEDFPPAAAFDKAVEIHAGTPEIPLYYPMAATCDSGHPIILGIWADSTEAFLLVPGGSNKPVWLCLTLEKLLPKLRFVYD